MDNASISIVVINEPQQDERYNGVRFTRLLQRTLGHLSIGKLASV